MSATARKAARTAAESARDCLMRSCWRQWECLQGADRAGTESSIRSIIDPEALVLGSLVAESAEARLRDLLAWWMVRGSHLMSLQRLKTMVRTYPEDLPEGIAWLASVAADAGDPRWSRLAASVSEARSFRPDKGPREPFLATPPTLMLRLRAGFGVGAKTDVLTFLIGVSGAEAQGGVSLPALAEATGYSKLSVRRALKDMVLAGLVHESGERNPDYRVTAGQWAPLLRHGGVPSGDSPAPQPPAWRFWGQVFALLAATSRWGRAVAADVQHPYDLAAEAADIAERFRRVCHWNGWQPPEPRMQPGRLYIEPFAEFVGSIVEWVDREL